MHADNLLSKIVRVTEIAKPPTTIDGALYLAIDHDTEPLSDYLEFAAKSLENFRAAELTGTQVEAISELLPGWIINNRHIRGTDYSFARRENTLLDPILPTLRSNSDRERRVIVIDEAHRVTMAAKAPLIGADIISLLRVEKALAETPDRMVFPKKRGSILNHESAELTGLTNHHKALLNLLAHETSEATKSLGATQDKYMSSEITKLQKKHGLTRRGIIKSAFEQDLIDLSPLPEIDWRSFDEKEIDMIRNFVLETYAYIEEHSDYTRSEIASIRESIHNKTDKKLKSKSRFYLVALRDGLIPSKKVLTN